MIKKILIMLCLMLSPLMLKAESITLVDNGDPSERIDVVFVSIDFDASEMPIFFDACDVAINKFQTIFPFSIYSSYFNFHAVAVVVEEPETDLSLALEAPDADEVIFIINNNTGRTHASLGGAAYVYLADVNYAIIHESGHSFNSMLMDAYVLGHAGEVYPWNEPFPPNVSTIIEGELKWQEWIDEGTPVPTPDDYVFPSGSKKIGMFEGAFYYPLGIYRPAKNCHMRTLLQPFCSVCRQALVRGFHGYEDILSLGLSTPEPGSYGIDPTNIPNNFNYNLTAPVLPPFPGIFEIERSIKWFINDVLVQEEGLTFSVNTDGLLIPGNSLVIKLVIENSTSLVRADPNKWMTREYVWNYFVYEEGSFGVIRVPEHFATIQGALDASPDGTIIDIGPGIYAENLKYIGSVALIGREGAEATIIDGNAMASVFGWNRRQFESDSDLVLQGLTFQNGDSKSGAGLNLGNSNSVSMKQCRVINNHTTIFRSAISCRSINVSIENCLISGNECDREKAAIFISNGNTDPLVLNFVNNTVADNVGGGGLEIQNAVDTSGVPASKIVNCIFSQNGEYGIQRINGGEVNVSYSNVWGHTEDLGQGINLGAGIISANPIFSNPSNDYRLSVLSPCIDAANGDSAPDTDINDRTRYDDPNTVNTGIGTVNYVDIGAFERQSVINQSIIIIENISEP